MQILLTRSATYVTNQDSGYVSVIQSNDTKEPHDIHVGNGPSFMISGPPTRPPNLYEVRTGNGPTEQIVPPNQKIYVMNSLDDTLSVINTENNTKEPHDIPLGAGVRTVDIYHAIVGVSCHFMAY